MFLIPIKINWIRGKYFGLALFYLGLMGLSQSLIFIPIGQYIMKVGSLYVVILLPLGVILAMTYSCQVLYESYLQSAPRRRRKAIRSGEIGFLGLNKIVWKPVIIVLAIFLVLFLFTNSIAGNYNEPINAFVISENVASVGILIFVSVLENRIYPSRR